jgi:hypothetical protein
MNFIELASFLKSPAFIQLHPPLITIHITCLSFHVSTIPILSHVHCNTPNFFLILTSISWDMQQFSNPVTITSAEISCYGTGPVAQWFYTGPLYYLHGARSYSPTKSHSEQNCLKNSLNGVFCTIRNYEAIHPGMTTQSIWTVMCPWLDTEFWLVIEFIELL